MRLQGKTALVSGEARGIGLAIATSFVAEGATAWLPDVAFGAGETASAALGAAARFAALDVRSEEDWRRVVDRVLHEDGRLDVLVNNAGVTGFEGGTGPHDPEHASLQDWRAVHAVNLDGVFLSW